MGKTPDLKIPCPNCDSLDFGIMSSPLCLLPSLSELKDGGYEITPNQGLAVMPVICNTCGFIVIFHPRQKGN